MTDTNNSIHSVTRTELLDLINLSITADEPLLIFGSPGIGKSETVHEIAAKHNYKVLDVRAGNIPPEDFAGIAWPEKETGEVKRLCPDVISAANQMKRDNPDQNVLIFLDEINHTPSAGQGALYSIVLDRMAAGYKLPENTRIVAAGNPEGTGSISEEMSRALLDRFMVVDYTGPTADEFNDYATKVRLNPIVRAFLYENPGLLNKFDPDMDVSPTPRSWSRLGNLLDYAQTDAIKMRAANSVVGSEAAFMLNAFIEMYGKVPTFEEIIQDPAGCKLPGQFSAQYMTGLMLANKLPHVWATTGANGKPLVQADKDSDDATTRKTIHKAIATYLMRMKVEVQATTVAVINQSRSVIDGGNVTHEFAMFITEADNPGIKQVMRDVRDLSVASKQV